jgi:tRNA(adenine34) deaminase
MAHLADDERWMRVALAEAAQAASHGDVPIGAVAVRDGEVIARGHNQRELHRDPTAHAELLVIRAAANALADSRLTGVTLYCTLEPCAMCAGAMILARLPRLVYAAHDPKAGAGGSLMDILHDPRLNHQVHVDHGLLADESAAMIRAFFRELRQAGEK